MVCTRLGMRVFEVKLQVGDMMSVQGGTDLGSSNDAWQVRWTIYSPSCLCATMHKRQQLPDVVASDHFPKDPVSVDLSSPSGMSWSWSCSAGVSQEKKCCWCESSYSVMAEWAIGARVYLSLWSGASSNLGWLRVAFATFRVGTFRLLYNDWCL